MNDFEWDEAKRLANIAKHGFDFLDAGLMWRGPVLDAYERRTADGEVRWTAIATLPDPLGGDAAVVAVLCTWRGTRRRIISIRAARRYERADHRAALG